MVLLWSWIKGLISFLSLSDLFHLCGLMPNIRSARKRYFLKSPLLVQHEDLLKNNIGIRGRWETQTK